MKADEVIAEVVKLCKSFGANEVILYGSRAKGTSRERSDIDIAVSGVDNFDKLAAMAEELPTLYSVDLLNICLLYTSDAADEEDSVDLGGCGIIKKKKTRLGMIS